MGAISEFKVEKSVPLPCPGRGTRKYPFADMEVGDSFGISADRWHAVRAAASAWGKVHSRKFSCRKTADGIRVWRIF